MEHTLTDMSPRAADATCKQADASKAIAESQYATPARESRKLGQSALLALLTIVGVATWKLQGNVLAWVLGLCAASIGGYLTVKAAVENKAKETINRLTQAGH